MTTQDANLTRQIELAEAIVALNGSLEIRETGKPTRAIWDYAPELAELVLAAHANDHDLKVEEVPES